MLNLATRVLRVCTIVWLGSLVTTSVLAAGPEQALVAVESTAAIRVLRIAAIQARDADGKPELVRDAGNREFRVVYNADGRVESVKATLRPHIADIKQIAYLGDGRVAGVLFEAGYALFFQYLPDGRQVVRDGFGGLLARTCEVQARCKISQLNDPLARLEGSLAGIDDLLAVTSGSIAAPAQPRTSALQ
jgi:YD repeat-containing protein